MTPTPHHHHRSRSRSRSPVPKGHHHRKRKRSRSRSPERKKKKREKVPKKKHRPTESHWGKYGIISEIDIFTKRPEFQTWLVEERKLNPETISKHQNKKEFARFIEDYNTATLPHEKYYHIDAYEKRMNALRAGEYLPPTDDQYDPAADIRAHQTRLKNQQTVLDSSSSSDTTFLTKERLLELRQVQHERNALGKMKILGMQVKQNMGVRMDGTMFDD